MMDAMNTLILIFMVTLLVSSISLNTSVCYVFLMCYKRVHMGYATFISIAYQIFSVNLGMYFKNRLHLRKKCRERGELFLCGVHILCFLQCDICNHPDYHAQHCENSISGFPYTLLIVIP